MVDLHEMLMFEVSRIHSHHESVPCANTGERFLPCTLTTHSSSPAVCCMYAADVKLTLEITDMSERVMVEQIVALSCAHTHTQHKHCRPELVRCRHFDRHYRHVFCMARNNNARVVLQHVHVHAPVVTKRNRVAHCCSASSVGEARDSRKKPTAALSAAALSIYRAVTLLSNTEMFSHADANVSLSSTSEFSVVLVLLSVLPVMFCQCKLLLSTFKLPSRRTRTRRPSTTALNAPQYLVAGNSDRTVFVPSAPNALLCVVFLSNK